MSLQNLKDSLRQGAAFVDEGKIKIDAARALQKLRDHRLPDPSLYVLDVLRCAVASDATAVHVTSTAKRSEIRFDGRPIRKDLFAALPEQALQNSKDPEKARARLLALGLAGALGMHPLRVTVSSGSLRLAVSPPEAFSVEKLEKPVDGCVIEVDERFNLSVLRDVFAGGAEARHVLAKTDHFPLPLTVNGKVRKAAHFEKEWDVEVRKESAGQILRVTPLDAPGPSRITFSVLGVDVSEKSLQLPGLPVRAHLRVDDLRRNASGTDVVENDGSYTRALNTLAAAQEELLQKLVQRLNDKGGAALRQHLLLIADAAFSEGSKAPATTKAILARAKLIMGPADDREEFFSRADFEAEVKAGRPLREARSFYPRGSYTAPAALLGHGHERIQKILPKTDKRVDVAAEVKKKREAKEREAAWAATPEEEPVLGSMKLVTGAAYVKGDDFSGQVAFSADRTSTLRLLCQKKLVQQGLLEDFFPLRFAAVVNVDRALPAASFLELPLPLEKFRGLKGALLDAALSALRGALQDREGKELPESLAADARGATCHLLLSGRAKKPAELPSSLLSAKAWPLAGGATSTLDALLLQSPVRYVSRPWPHGALDDKPVFVLSTEESEAVSQKLGRDLLPMAERLQRELEVRRALSSSKEEPKVTGRALVRVPIQGDGFRGEVTLPSADEAGLSLTLLRDGYPLEKASLTPRYEIAAAAVDCPALNPDPLWRHAVRDGEFERVFAAVREGERKLMETLVDQKKNERFDELPSSVRRYVAAFLVKELGPSRAGRIDALARRAEDAFFFRTSYGELPLSEVTARLSKEKAVLHVPLLVAKDAKDQDLFALSGELSAAELVGRILGRAVENGAGELDRRRTRAAFEKRPQLPLELSPRPPLLVRVKNELFAGEVGFADGLEHAQVDVLYKSRALVSFTLPSPFGLRALFSLQVDHDVAGHLPSLEEDVAPLCDEARGQLVKKALGSPADAPDVRALLLRALPRAEKILGKEAHALLSRPLYPALGEKPWPAARVDGLGKVAYVTRPFEAPEGNTVFLAEDLHVRAALTRFGSRAVDVTASLALNEEARKRRLAQPEWKEITLRSKATFKRALVTGGARGEVGLCPNADEHGVLQTFSLSRPLLGMPTPKPLPRVFHAAVNVDALRLTADGAALEEDEAYGALMRLLVAEVHALARKLEEELPTMPAEEAEALRPTAAQLALWCKADRPKAGALQTAPLFRTTAGALVSLKALFSEHGTHKRLRHAARTGTLLDAAAVVLHPRDGELAALEGLKLKLQDVGLELERAEKLLNQPKVETLRAMSDSIFRAPIDEAGEHPLRGEVAIVPEGPTNKLSLQLVRDGLLLETAESEHPIGGVAVVSSPSFRPNAKQTGVQRDAAFRSARQAVDRALAKALVLRFDRSKGGAGQRHYAAAVSADDAWGKDPAVASALAALTPFQDLLGRPVSLGEVWARVEAEGELLTAYPGTAVKAPEGVIDQSFDAEAWLAALEIPSRDITESLRAEKQRAQSREKRKVAKLAFPGHALHRREVEVEGMRGQLCVPADAEKPARVTLVKDGVSICEVALPGELCAGMVELDGLTVDAEWKAAELTPEQRKRLEGEAEATVAEACAKSDGLDDDGRTSLAARALRELSRAGVTAAAHVENLAGPAQSLSRAKVFATADGRWVDALSLATEVRRRGTLHLVKAELPKDRLVEELTLNSRRLPEGGAERLTKLFGEESVRSHPSLAAFDRARAEVDPDLDTPLGRGLLLLRKESRLLRTHAMGRLTDKELTAIRVERGDGARPLRYDETRRVALLDVAHPSVRRALEEAAVRPERIYVLLAAIFGAVNRALERVTDEDEGRLTSALLAHLSANREVLAGR